MNEYLHHIIATRNTGASVAVGELALVIPRCRTDQFCLLSLHALCVCGTCCHRVCLVVAF